MSNFTFLQQEFPKLYEAAMEAESDTFSKPKFAALQCRITLEFAMAWLYDNDPELERPYDRTLSGLLHHYQFRNTIDAIMFQELNLVRRIGNKAAHGTKTTKQEALICLRSIFRFTTFISKYYSVANPEIPAFEEAFIPTATQTIKDNTAKELKSIAEKATKQLKELQLQKEREAALIAENELLKRQLEQQKLAFITRKQLRKESINAAVEIPTLTPEQETRKLYIDILLHEAGWKGLKKGTDLEFKVTGMPVSTNPSGKGAADYVLWGNNGLPLAVIEAKQTLVDARKGKQQAVLYADCLEQMTGQRPIIFYSNGFETYIWDDTFYTERQIHGFYTKEELNYRIEQRNSRKDIRQFQVNTAIVERPYQLEAIKRVAETLVVTHKGDIKGKHREALLVMATGSGKTRTSAAIVDMLTKCNWAKRILFLADRNALVTQAKNAFKEHLPHLSAIDLTKEKDDNKSKLVFSTYPTILNKIDLLNDTDERFFGVGHFDVVIIDEAHRSVYQKYGAIFDYFDAILIGLTATPKNDIDHNTYSLFGIEDEDPTFAYELTQAVDDEYLNPPKAIKVPVKFVREGVKYKELSEEDKRKFEEKFGNYEGNPDSEEADISKSDINKFLFNEKTVDIVLDFLMTNGIKVDSGDKLGKTIIFAKNHNHAIFIEKRFNKNYPQYGGHFLRVIDNYESKAQALLEKFCDDKEELLPQIAVSVDMMDTGVDAPRVVNLVFFKEVRSYAKYWQMIGRGTRLRPDLFGIRKDKKHFLIFDFCGNFEFFDEFPDGLKTTISKSLSQSVFETKLNIITAIRDNVNASAEEDTIAENYTNQLYEAINELDETRFEVRKVLRFVKQYKVKTRWDNLTVGDVADICTNLSNLPVYKDGDSESAKRFDLLVLRLQLALVTTVKSPQSYIQQIYDIGITLYKKRNIPMVASKLGIIQQIIDQDFWKEINVTQIEHIRIELRELIFLIKKEGVLPVYTNMEDILLEDGVEEVDILPTYTKLQSYKDRVESFIRKNKSHLVIDKLHKNIPITDRELALLESLLFEDEIGSKEQYKREYGEVSLGNFIRSIVGLDIGVVNTLFSEYIQNENLQPNQITFIQTLINYLNVNGTLDKSLLVKPPFNETHDDGIIGIFDDEKDIRGIISIIDTINRNAN
ncbi:type I restriction enzyme R subunit [Kordia periserrulae]|uniref:Type I restriction enzyme R subunit n=1 Tax=Kordia periserrulae TaxID=701523 RepID=A0A2T6BYS4_9FLAO|nr:DEAD/DEAH box helicase family protein [Kordia periserrulae]PTX61117.1 type I restriction enzyme R subunit [Kordia periserrulae]